MPHLFSSGSLAGPETNQSDRPSRCYELHPKTTEGFVSISLLFMDRLKNALMGLVEPPQIKTHLEALSRKGSSRLYPIPVIGNFVATCS